MSWARVASVLRDLFTGIDKNTYDLGRVLWALSVGVLIAVGATQVCATVANLVNYSNLVHPWSPEDWVVWSGAVGAQLPLGAGALLIKARTEPRAVPQDLNNA